MVQLRTMAQILIFSDTLSIGWGRSAGPYRIATELRDAGYSVQVVEFYAFYSSEEIQRIVDRFVDERTLLVGLSTTFLHEQGGILNDREFIRRELPSNWLASDPRAASEAKMIRELFAKARQRNPSCKTVLGGALVEPFLASSTGADYIVHGAADRAVVELVRHIENPAHPIRWSDPDRKTIHSYRDYPFEGYAASQTVFHESDHIRKEEVLPVEASRGCAFNCGFCDYPLNGKQRGTWERDPGIFREELIRNFENFQVTDYIFTDNNLNDNPRKIEELHKAVTSLPFKIRWHSFARVDMYLRHPEMIDMVLDMGCVSHFFGLETLSPAAGKLIGKRVSPDQALSVFEKIKTSAKSGFSISTGLIAGLPGESFAEFERNLDLLMDSGVVDSWSINPLFLSQQLDMPFARNPKKYGFRFPDPGDPTYWEREDTNSRAVAEFTADLHMRTLQRNHIGEYYLFRVMALGFSFDEVRRLTLLEIQNYCHLFGKRLLRLKNEYLKNLLA